MDACERFGAVCMPLCGCVSVWMSRTEEVWVCSFIRLSFTIERVSLWLHLVVVPSI